MEEISDVRITETGTKTNENPTSSRQLKKPSLNVNYSIPATQSRTIPRSSRRIENLVEEFDFERYSANLKYNAMAQNIRSFIEGEKDNLSMLQNLKTTFKNSPGFKIPESSLKDIRSMSSEVQVGMEMILSTLRKTESRYKDLRVHETEMEYISSMHKPAD